MAFVTDKQSLDDLNLLGRYNSTSIFHIFNRTVTIGGSRLLEKMFQHPFTDAGTINRQSAIFQFFERTDTSLPFDSKAFELLENYIGSSGPSNKLALAYHLLQCKLLDFLTNRKEYDLLKENLNHSIQVLSLFKKNIERIASDTDGGAYHQKANQISRFLNNKSLQPAWALMEKRQLSFMEVLRLDYLLRSRLYHDMQDLLNDIYELDVYLTVASVSREKGFTYAKVVDKNEAVIDIEGLYHPCIENAIPNDIHIGEQKHVLFLTGANMAGKSTFMKSFGVALYLGHMGFPVPAKKLFFSVHDGIYSSINVPDNLSLGHSHFYAEVLRVKHIAQEVSTNKHLIIIFDELFKGTNVKDAADGTVAIVDAFSKWKGTFIVSTHIMEAGEILSRTNAQVFFKFLPTKMKGAVPSYPYTLEDGITNDRQGMTIIQNEGILDIINGKL